MEQRKKIKEEILISKNLKMLTRAYQEHAIEQINFARYSVIASREFSDDLEQVFIDVKTSYKELVTELLAKQKKGKVAELKKNGKEIMVLITANNKLYGDIIPKICQLFYEQAKTSNADLAVIGKQGKSYIDNSGLGKNYQYFELPDTNVQLTQLKPITETFIQYDKVTVFHGKFNNMVSQEAVEAYVSGDIPQDDNTEKTKQRFIFEPSVTNILEFFENQIFSLLLSQTVQEAQLARFGSRIKAMELAQENMQKWLSTLLQKEQRLKNITQNKKQMELFAGRALWAKR